MWYSQAQGLTYQSRLPSSSMSSWTCKLCNLTTQVDKRKSHITSKRHRETAISKIPESDRWTCDVCHNTTMHVNNKDSHCSGREHLKRSARRTRPRAPVPTSEWKCDVCVDRQPMKLKDKDAHVNSKSHQEKLKLPNPSSSSGVPAPPDATPAPSDSNPSGFGRGGRGSSGRRGGRGRAGAGRGGRGTSSRGRGRGFVGLGGAGSGQGNGDGDDDDEPEGSSGGSSDGSGDEGPEDPGVKLHPNGKRRIPIRDVEKVYGYDYPLEAYRDAGMYNARDRTLVTPEDVERASDAYDARGILHDVDTQWGMIPGGGAYKESNFYYGPDQYDFY